MSVSLFEVEQVSALANDAGYKLLLSYLQADLDGLTNDLEKASSAETSTLLGKWRAFRHILAILKAAPESFALDLAQKQADVETDPSMFPQLPQAQRPPLPLEKIRKLEEIYMALRDEKDK